MGVINLLGIKEFVMGWLNLIPKFMYFLCVTLMSLIDCMQFVVRKLAGLDVYYVNNVPQEGDIALSFIKSIFTADSTFPALKNAFWSLVIFGVLLLFVTSIIAAIRQEYMPSDEDKKEKPNNNRIVVVRNFIKSLFMFLIVPVSCIFGLLILDVTLVTIDGVLNNSIITSTNVLSEVPNLDSKLKSETTTNGKQTYVFYDFFGSGMPCTSVTFSGTMFKTAAFSANRVRQDNIYDGKTFGEGLSTGEISNFGLFTLTDFDKNAELIDIAFASNFKLKSEQQINLGFMEETVSAGALWKIDTGDTVDGFSKYNIPLVFYFYDLWYFNFIIGFAFLVIALRLFFNLIVGLMKRIIEMVGLFIISSPVIAITPMDSGKALKKWRETFLSKALSAIASIVGINLVFLILPYIDMFTFFEFSLLNSIMSSIFILVGLSLIETFIALVSKMIGAEDINKSGSELATKVGERLASSATLAGGVAGAVMAFHPIGLAAKPLAMKAVKGAKNIAQNIKTSQVYKSIERGLFSSKKDREEAQNKSQKDFYEGRLTEETNQALKKDQTYQQDIQKAYEKYRENPRANKSMDEWLESNKKAKQIRLEAIERNKEQIIKAGQQKYLNEKTEGMLKNKASKFARASGVSNITSLASIYFKSVKGGFVRGGKGGLKTMIMAFSGQNSKRIDEKMQYEKLKDEQTARATIAQKEREKIRKNSKK